MEFCLCDSLLVYVLKHIQEIPECTFNKNELKNISQKSFDKLKSIRLLKYKQYDWENEPYFSNIPGDSGNERFIKKIKDKYYALPVENSGYSLLEVNEDELHKYEFDLIKLLGIIKTENNISDELQELSKDCYYLGTKQYGENKVGFIFVKNADSLIISGIQKTCSEKNLVVFTPIKKLDKFDLAGRNIINFSLSESLKNDFGLDLDLSSFNIHDDGLTEQQRLDYEKYKYLCYDKIRIMKQEPKNRTYTVYVNEKSVQIGESLYKLLMRLAAELKKGNGGWVNVYTLYGDRIITDPDKYHIYSDLRSKLDGCILKGNAKELIESDGSKNYRLSVHPDFINIINITE